MLVACSTRRYIVAWVGPKRAARGTGRGTGLSTASFDVVVAALLLLHDEEERKSRTTGHGMRIDESGERKKKTKKRKGKRGGFMRGDFYGIRTSLFVLVDIVPAILVATNLGHNAVLISLIANNRIAA